MNIHKDNPCRLCEERVVGCHARCAEHQAYLAEREKIKSFNRTEDNVAYYYKNVHDNALKRYGSKKKVAMV